MVHHDPSLATRPLASVENIPVTRMAWTVLDMCAVLSHPAATEVVIDVVRRRFAGVLDLSRVLDEAAGKRGGQMTLARILTTRFAQGVTDSDLEDLFIDMAARRELTFAHHFVVHDPPFRAELDFADVPILLNVETDGGKDHDDPVAEQSDKNRDAELIGRGWTVLRFTYWDLVGRPDWVFARVRDTQARLEGTTRRPGIA
jgi:very-short-patch-repair endonuclease